ncbi:MAG: 4a-hydroxytetrahydrobiopterin dehydratase [Bacteroidia bacterium]|nr:4a-hydroxytetrahydrobiopterin dehydratase [Bacteroidia bacterium]
MRLSEQEVLTCLRCLPGWVYNSTIPAIEKEFVFDSFLNAIQFISKASHFIDLLNHHPEWKNVYNKVQVVLYTHDIQGISTLDIQLAHYLESVYRTL